MKANTDFDYRESVRKLTPAYKSIMMSHDYCRSVYMVMLMDFPEEWVTEFWAKHPVVLPDRTIKGAALLRFLWSQNEKIPLYWDCEIANAVEPFLVSKGKFGYDFTARMLYRNNSSSYIPGKKILSWFYPFMNAAYNLFDARDMVFKLIPVFSESIWRTHLHRRVKRIEADGWVQSYMVYITDTTFENRGHFNFDWLAGAQIKAAPKVFGFDPFEKVEYLTDSRRVQDVLWTGNPAMEDSNFVLDGERIGHATTFNAILKTHKLNLAKFRPPDTDVILMEKDIYCPLRKRIVLYAGCAYGAPLYTTRVHHQKRPVKNKNLLASLVADAGREVDLFESELEKKHLAGMARMEARSTFVYYPADQSLSLNGKHFLKNVPAKILNKILMAYTREGKQEFEYRDFKRDFDISFGRKNSNFEIRFYRLLEKLEQEKTGIRIRKLSPGSFAVETDVVLEYREAEGTLSREPTHSAAGRAM